MRHASLSAKAGGIPSPEIAPLSTVFTLIDEASKAEVGIDGKSLLCLAQAPAVSQRSKKTKLVEVDDEAVEKNDEDEDVVVVDGEEASAGGDGVATFRPAPEK